MRLSFGGGGVPFWSHQRMPRTQPCPRCLDSGGVGQSRCHWTQGKRKREERESQAKWEWIDEESNYACTDKRYNAWLCMTIQRQSLWTIAYPKINTIPSIRPSIANMLQTPPQVNLFSRMCLAPDYKEWSRPQDVPTTTLHCRFDCHHPPPQHKASGTGISLQITKGHSPQTLLLCPWATLWKLIHSLLGELKKFRCLVSRTSLGSDMDVSVPSMGLWMILELKCYL